MLGGQPLLLVIPPAMHLKAHQYILLGGEAFVQVMCLKDKPEFAASRNHLVLGSAVQLCAEQINVTFLNIPQAPHQG